LCPAAQIEVTGILNQIGGACSESPVSYFVNVINPTAVQIPKHTPAAAEADVGTAGRIHDLFESTFLGEDQIDVTVHGPFPIGECWAFAVNADSYPRNRSCFSEIGESQGYGDRSGTGQAHT